MIAEALQRHGGNHLKTAAERGNRRKTLAPHWGLRRPEAGFDPRHPGSGSKSGSYSRPIPGSFSGIRNWRMSRSPLSKRRPPEELRNGVPGSVGRRSRPPSSTDWTSRRGALGTIEWPGSAKIWISGQGNEQGEQAD
jgi:hypothetical protein